MPVDNYGVWVAHPTRFTAQRAREDPKSPHIHLYFTDGPQTDGSGRAAINVKSIGKDSRLVYWVERDFSHPFTETLARLESGFQPLGNNPRRRDPRYETDGDAESMQGLDYIRTKELVHIESGRVLPHDLPGPDNDILDEMEPFLQNVIDEGATAYIFGASFGNGIHDVHMNQGSLPRFDNGVWEDGALFFRFRDHWEAIFLAFASQRIPTNDKDGLAEKNSQSLADILGQ